MPFPFDATLKDIVAERPDDFAVVFELPSGEPVQSVNVAGGSQTVGVGWQLSVEEAHG